MKSYPFHHSGTPTPATTTFLSLAPPLSTAHDLLCSSVFPASSSHICSLKGVPHCTLPLLPPNKNQLYIQILIATSHWSVSRFLVSETPELKYWIMNETRQILPLGRTLRGRIQVSSRLPHASMSSVPVTCGSPGKTTVLAACGLAGP